MSTIHAAGVSVRHAISRAIATANLRPRDATYQVLTARADVGRSGRVLRGEVSLRLQSPAALQSLPLEERVGWVNPDGAHPLMALVPLPSEDGTHFVYMDVYPVTWDAWLRVMDDTLPDGIDSLCPITSVELEQARTYARHRRVRLPSLQELRAVWGGERFPWGARPDPRLGRVGRPRFDQVHQVGLHPPASFAIFDLGAWHWQWLDDGSLAGGADELVPGFGADAQPQRGPLGFRCVQDLEP